MLDAIRKFLTAERRKLINAFTAAAVVLLVNLGTIPGFGGEAILLSVAGALSLLAAVIQLANFEFKSLLSWFENVGRAAVYAAAGVVGAVLLVLGLVDQTGADLILANTSQVLSVVAALVAIFNVTPDPLPDVEVTDAH